MAIEFSCSGGNRRLQASENNVGKRARCPHCGALTPITRIGELDAPQGDSTGASQNDPDDPLGIGGSGHARDDPLHAAAQQKQFQTSTSQTSNYGYGNQPFPQTSYSGSSAGPGFVEPHRATMISTFGIISMITGILTLVLSVAPLGCCCCGPFAVLAVIGEIIIGVASLIMGTIGWTMANQDIPKMETGQMDSFGLSSVKSGRVFAMFGVGLVAIAFVVTIIIIIINVLLYGTFMLQQNNMNRINDNFPNNF